MEITLLNKESQKREIVEILHFESINYDVNLHIIRTSPMTLNDGEHIKDERCIEIFKVSHTAICKTVIGNSIAVAFFLNNDSMLEPVIFGGLTDKYKPEKDSAILIDYNSYCSICDLTKEEKRSFIDFVHLHASKNNVEDAFVWDMINTVLYYNGETYNYTEQVELFKTFKNG